MIQLMLQLNQRRLEMCGCRFGDVHTLKGGIVSYVDATLIIIKGNNQAMLGVRYVKNGKLLVISNLGWNNKIGKISTWIKICLGDGKLYSPNSCVFLDKVVNNFMTERGNDRGDYPIGVILLRGKYVTQCNNPFTGKRGHIGCYSSVDDAYNAYRRGKFEFAKELASIQTDLRVTEALIERYNFHNL